jgi:hypothetical protein
MGLSIIPALALGVILTHTNSDITPCHPSVQDFYIMQPTPPKPPQVTPDPEKLEISPELEEALVPDAPVNTTLDTTPKNYYQAIGWLRGVVVKEEERYCVRIRDTNFTLYLPRRVIMVAAALEGKLAWMKCYPQSKGEGLSFKVVWMGTEQHEKSDPGIFVLRGVWQFIPQCRRPVFSVYRNELKSYENRPNNQHLPLIWSDQPPYRFRKDSEERPKFYQIMARLIPQRSCFGFVEQIAEPVEQTPKRVKKPPMNLDGSEKKFDHGDRKFKAKQESENHEQDIQTETETETEAETIESEIVGTIEPETPVVEKVVEEVVVPEQGEIVSAETAPETKVEMETPEPLSETKKTTKATKAKATKATKNKSASTTKTTKAKGKTPPAEE